MTLQITKGPQITKNTIYYLMGIVGKKVLQFHPFQNLLPCLVSCCLSTHLLMGNVVLSQMKFSAEQIPFFSLKQRGEFTVC